MVQRQFFSDLTLISQGSKICFHTALMWPTLGTEWQTHFILRFWMFKTFKIRDLSTFNTIKIFPKSVSSARDKGKKKCSEYSTSGSNFFCWQSLRLKLLLACGLLRRHFLSLLSRMFGLRVWLFPHFCRLCWYFSIRTAGLVNRPHRLLCSPLKLNKSDSS